MKREVSTTSRWSASLGSRTAAIALGMLITCAALCLAFLPLALVRTTGTFRTQDLVVDNTETIGGSLFRTFAGNPNGSVTAAEGSLILDSSTPALWQNVDGATAWVKVGGFSTGSSVYYADGSDGTCNFDGVTSPVCGATLSGSTYTLQRDTAPMNAIVAAGVTVRTDNWRFMVFDTLMGGGAGATISNSGFPGVGRALGNCGGISTHYYQACHGSGGAGSFGTGPGGTGDGNATAIPQWPTVAATPPDTNGGGHGQGGGGGSTGAHLGGTGGSIANPSVNAGLFTAVGGWSGKADAYGITWGLYGTGGGGGGCDDGAGGPCTAGGAGGAGGILFVSANQCTGTIVLRSDGGAGAAGVLNAGNTGAGGGAGGGGGILTFLYSHREAGCTTSVAGGVGGAGVGTGGNGGNGSSGSAFIYNISGDGT
jgi:hypothetical protein